MSNSSTSSSGGTGGNSAPPEPDGPPYLPHQAQLGGKPTRSIDVPVCAVLLVVFLALAAMNMAIFQINRRIGFKFLFTGLLFGFCMARVVALATRIAWALHPDDENLAIASQIFVAAGVLLLFITNLVFAQRMIRAYHRFFGWSPGVTRLFRGLFSSIVAVLAMVITVTVQSFFTLNRRTHRIDKGIQLFCGVYLAVIAFLPIPLVLAAALVPRRTPIDRFGVGHFRTKFGLLTFTSVLLATGAIFRAATNFVVRPLNNPAWAQTKTAFYCFNFGIELVVVITYLLSRFDRRFHIPDGSSAPGHYSMSEYGVLAGANVGAGIGGARNSTVNGGGGAGVTGGTTTSSVGTNGKKRVSRGVLDPILDAVPMETETGTGIGTGTAAVAGFTAVDLPHIYESAGSRRGSHWSLLSKSVTGGTTTSSVAGTGAVAAAGFTTADLPHIYESAGSRRGSHWSLLSKSRKIGGSSLSLPELPFSETHESIATTALAGDPDMEWMARAMRELYGDDDDEE
ncbi:hypothetical protein B0H65DRAFT_292960 [Neurospora tetraspora]|uniref:Uncharacterized protein n=1 Tax=Neurospora tetraspora TaxID=94610 RepID=A0AAE0J8U3_9PEZI|nr:hypothetical protein B0H65DRAFT_292960 [Neurospora tetraspora]